MNQHIVLVCVEKSVWHDGLKQIVESQEYCRIRSVGNRSVGKGEILGLFGKEIQSKAVMEEGHCASRE